MQRERTGSGSGKRNQLIQPFIETSDFFTKQNTTRKKAAFHAVPAALPMLVPQLACRLPGRRSALSHGQS